MGGKPTLKTIAELSGLATPTVSRALGDAPDISAATKKRVREIAERIGYTPNRAGLRLRTGRTHVISLVISTEHEVMDLTARLISSIALGLRGTPYHLTITPFLPGDDRLQPVRYVVENATADAVILNQIQPCDPRIDYLLERKFPFATHGRSTRAGEHAWFDFDNRIYARMAVERLAGRGRRRLLMIAPPRDEAYAREMIAGAAEAARAAGIALEVASGVSIDSGIAEIGAAVAVALDRDPALDGLLTGAPVATLAAVTGFEAAGRVLGRDFDCVSKDTVPILPLFRREIAVVQEDVGRAGDFLARAAMAAAKQPKAAPMQFLDVPAPF